jgi:hypothetical protein
MMSLKHRSTSVAAVAATRPASAHVDAGSESAFDWGDAGIGAGAALATTMIGLGGALVAGARRRSAIG